jgi:hypothetical protein
MLLILSFLRGIVNDFLVGDTHFFELSHQFGSGGREHSLLEAGKLLSTLSEFTKHILLVKLYF